MSNTLSTLLILLCLIVPSDTHAQQGYTVEHYTADNGLPQNSVKSLSVDAQGFIWLATEDGLVRFDGTDFYVYNRSNLSVRSSRVADIKPALRQCQAKGDSTLPAENTAVSYAYFDSDETVSMKHNRVIPDAAYLAKRKGRLLALEKETGKIFEASGQYLHKGADLENYLESKLRNYLVPTGYRDGDFYLCDKDRVRYYENWQKKYETGFRSKGIGNFFSLGERLYYFHDKQFFTSIFNNKLTQMPVSGDILKDPLFKKAKLKDIKLFWNHNTDQAFLYFNKKLYGLDQHKDGQLTCRLLMEGFDLVMNSVLVVYLDKASRNIYLGSLTDGLFVLKKHQFKTITSGNDSNDNVFYAQIPFDENSVLTPKGLMLGIDPSRNQIIAKKIPAMLNSGPHENFNLIRDTKGHLWVKNTSSLARLNPRDGKMLAKYKFTDEVVAIYQGKTNKIWVGVMNQGLYCIDPWKKNAVPEAFIRDTLKNITFFESLSQDRLLVGTKTGLYHLDLATKKLKRIEATKGLHIKSIHLFNKNQAWVTALDKGLMLLDRRTDQVTRFPLDRQRYLTTPHCAVNDGRGYLWIPTNKGLFQMAIKDLLEYAAFKNRMLKEQSSGSARTSGPLELFYMYHGMEEGLNTNEFNGGCQPCSAVLANGYISLPSLNGLVWFRPGQISNYLPEADIVLDHVEINQQSFAIAGDTLSFPSRPENIRFRFSTAYFGNDYNLNVSYALKKLDSDDQPATWMPLDRRDFSVRYSSLASGAYVLMIRKQNGFGLNHYSIKKMYIMIPPLWYETLQARFLAGLAALLGIYLFVLYRLRKIARENAGLENIISQRTASLKHTLSELQASKTKMTQQVHIMSRLLASISHDVRSPLHYITFATANIPQMIQKGQLEEVAGLGTILSDLSSRTGHMLEDLLNYIKVQVYGSRMYFEKVNLKTLVDDKIEIFRSVAQRNGNRVTNEVPDQTEVRTDYQLLSIVIHNLLDNAAKYTHDGEIRIYAEANGNHLTEMVISNTESAFSKELIELINAPADVIPVSNAVRNEKVVGLGLLIVREISALIGVRIKITQTDVIRFHLLFE